MSSALQSRFTVSGPGLDVAYSEEGPALSRAITAVEQTGGEVSFYVRDSAGQLVALADRDESGVVTVRRVWRGS